MARLQQHIFTFTPTRLGALLLVAAAACSKSGAGPGTTGNGGTAGSTTTTAQSSSSSSSSSSASGSTVGMGGTGGVGGGSVNKPCDPAPAPDSFFAQGAVTYPDYEEVTMCRWRGDVVLVVNTAAI